MLNGNQDTTTRRTTQPSLPYGELTPAPYNPTRVREPLSCEDLFLAAQMTRNSKIQKALCREGISCSTSTKTQPLSQDSTKIKNEEAAILSIFDNKEWALLSTVDEEASIDSYQTADGKTIFL